MGYFSNGTEGEDYKDRYCDRCVNWQDRGDGRGPGCSVWDVHLLYNYQQQDNEELREVMDRLIPRGKMSDEPWNLECSMFTLPPPLPPLGQILEMHGQMRLKDDSG